MFWRTTERTTVPRLFSTRFPTIASAHGASMSLGRTTASGGMGSVFRVSGVFRWQRAQWRS